MSSVALQKNLHIHLVFTANTPLKSKKDSASSSSHLGANAEAALQNEDEEENNEEEEETGLMSFFGARAL